MSTTTASARQLPGTANRPHFLPDETWRGLIAAIMDGRFDPMDRENAVRLALGEIGNIWPVSVKQNVT